MVGCGTGVRSGREKVRRTGLTAQGRGRTLGASRCAAEALTARRAGRTDRGQTSAWVGIDGGRRADEMVGRRQRVVDAGRELHQGIFSTIGEIMSRFDGWDGFCEDIFDSCGDSGVKLKMVYGAGGITLILVIVSLMGFTPFLFATSLLGFLITPPGMIVAAVLGAMAVPFLKGLFSERETLQPVLKRLTEAKEKYAAITSAWPDVYSMERRSQINALFCWVKEGK